MVLLGAITVFRALHSLTVFDPRFADNDWNIQREHLMPNRLPLLLLTALVLSGCAGVRDLLQPKPPNVSVEGIRVTALGFNHAGLDLELRVENPNAVTIKLAGFDYRLAVDGRSVLQGDRKRSLELPAKDATTLEVPLRLNFGDVAAVIGSLAGRDRIDYEIAFGVDVDVPVLGQRRVEAVTADSLPIPHRPDIALRSLRVTKLDVTGATIETVLAIDNPNGFALALDRLQWDLVVDGAALASGGSTTPLRVGPNDTGTLRLDINLDHGDIAGSLATLLGGTRSVEYRLGALIEATADDQRLGSFKVPVEHTGRVMLE